MPVERVGQFIEFVADEGGTRTLARISAIQIVAETDPIGQETFITVANRTFRVGASLDEMKAALVEAGLGAYKFSGRSDPSRARPKRSVARQPG